MLLYYTGYQAIPSPDVMIGRINADFGQGFYLTENRAFALGWAPPKAGQTVYINTYDLDLTGLHVVRLRRDRTWSDYILNNRRALEDTMKEADVIVGPIANDTIYDTIGIITSGMLSPNETLRLLLIGPEYTQTVLKTEKAAARLTYRRAKALSPDETFLARSIIARGEMAYQALVARALEEMT